MWSYLLQKGLACWSLLAQCSFVGLVIPFLLSYCIYLAISWAIFTQSNAKVQWNLSPIGVSAYSWVFWINLSFLVFADSSSSKLRVLAYGRINTVLYLDECWLPIGQVVIKTCGPTGSFTDPYWWKASACSKLYVLLSIQLYFVFTSLFFKAFWIYKSIERWCGNGLQSTLRRQRDRAVRVLDLHPESCPDCYLDLFSVVLSLSPLSRFK